jgi:hypothetical protein
MADMSPGVTAPAPTPTPMEGGGSVTSGRGSSGGGPEAVGAEIGGEGGGNVTSGRGSLGGGPAEGGGEGGGNVMSGSGSSRAGLVPSLKASHSDGVWSGVPGGGHVPAASHACLASTIASSRT